MGKKTILEVLLQVREKMLDENPSLQKLQDSIDQGLDSVSEEERLKLSIEMLKKQINEELIPALEQIEEVKKVSFKNFLQNRKNLAIKGFEASQTTDVNQWN